jgi:Ala-tRNA(Pro) deacylase
MVNGRNVLQEIEERIFTQLKSARIEYIVHEHDPVYTCKQMAQFLNIDENLVAKSLMLKKNDGMHVLAVLPGNTRLDFKRLAKIANAKEVALAPAKEVEAIAGCSIGAVYPLGNLLHLPTYFDAKMLDHEYVYFNPGSHTKSVKIQTKSLVDFVKPIVTEIGNGN